MSLFPAGQTLHHLLECGCDWNKRKDVLKEGRFKEKTQELHGCTPSCTPDFVLASHCCLTA